MSTMIGGSIIHDGGLDAGDNRFGTAHTSLSAAYMAGVEERRTATCRVRLESAHHFETTGTTAAVPVGVALRPGAPRGALNVRQDRARCRCVSDQIHSMMSENDQPAPGAAGGDSVRRLREATSAPPVPATPSERDITIAQVLDSAARLQQRVPDAVLVGGTAAAHHAGHRYSLDHHHVLADLASRFDTVLEALEREPDWVLNRATPGKIILGSLGDIEAGVRQMIRTRPLEVEDVVLPSGRAVRVPTAAETLRIKAFLVVRRNQMRDYLDVAALSDFLGVAESARILADVDRYYEDESRPETDSVATQVARQLAAPRPRDHRRIDDLPRYKGLVERWHDWTAVTAQCRAVSAAMLEAGAG